jgi:hypothetical protein
MKPVTQIQAVVDSAFKDQPSSEVTALSVRDQIYQRVFPDSDVFQEWITHLTGCPYTGQKPLLLLTNYHYIVLYLTAFLGGILLSWMSWNNGDLPLVLVGWILTIGGSAGCNVGLIHQASHRNLTDHKGFDVWFGRVLSILILMVDFDQYVEGHAKHHGVKTHQTHEDNTINLLDYIGCRPGLLMKDYWQVVYNLINPFFLIRFIGQRRLAVIFFKSYFASKLLAWIFWGAMIAIVCKTHSELPFFMAYVIPVLLLYSPVYIIRYCVEHKLPPEAICQNRNKRYVALSTDAVFLGEVPPSEALAGLAKTVAWTGWWMRLLLWHGMWRWLVCPYDVPVHDYHTRMAGHSREDAANAIWHRQAQQAAGCPGWPTQYTEVWGFVNAMRTVFTSFSQLPTDYRF